MEKNKSLENTSAYTWGKGGLADGKKHVRRVLDLKALSADGN